MFTRNKGYPGVWKSGDNKTKKRRYRCTDCGKRFYERNTFLPRYHRATNRLFAYVINALSCECSFTSVAKGVNLSVSTVIKIFNLVTHKAYTPPEAYTIDESKGNTNGEKYPWILADPVNKVVLDILPTRYAHEYLENIFRYIIYEI